MHNISFLTNQQKLITKDHLINFNIKFYEILPSFSLDHYISNNFPNCFFFNLANKIEKEINKIYTQELNNIILCNFFLLNIVLVIINTSIKNNITMFILHIHTANCSLIKTVHYTLFIMFLRLSS